MMSRLTCNISCAQSPSGWDAYDCVCFIYCTILQGTNVQPEMYTHKQLQEVRPACTDDFPNPEVEVIEGLIPNGGRYRTKHRTITANFVPRGDPLQTAGEKGHGSRTHSWMPRKRSSAIKRVRIDSYHTPFWGESSRHNGGALPTLTRVGWNDISRPRRLAKLCITRSCTDNWIAARVA